MTLRCLNFLTLIPKMLLRTCKKRSATKSGWSMLRQKKGESYHERTQSAGSGICTYKPRVKG